MSGDRVLRYEDGRMVDLTPTECSYCVLLDANRSIVFMPDGKVLFSHICDRQERGILRCVPELQIGSGHTIVNHNPLTIVASIACPDCGDHGFVTEGRWIAV